MIQPHLHPYAPPPPKIYIRTMSRRQTIWFWSFLLKFTPLHLFVMRC